MTGHPWIVFNKGRLGWSASDALRYAPEARHQVRLPWIAVDTDLAEFAAVRNLTSQRLYTNELDSNTRIRFGAELVRNGFNPARYWWLPVHPWQWDEMIQPLFGPEVAAGLIVPLGYADDEYLPQQSIRTFSNVDPARPAPRGAPAVRAQHDGLARAGDRAHAAAPAVTSWLLEIAEDDPFLREECRLVLLGEVASVTVRHPVLDRMPDAPYQYRELLGAVWRQPAAAPAGRAGARPGAGLAAARRPGRPAVRAGAGRALGAGRRRLAGQALRGDPAAAAALPLQVRDGVLAARRECDRHLRRQRSPVKAGDQGLRRRRQPVGQGPAGARRPAEAVEDVLPREMPDYLCQSIHAGLFVGHFRYLAHVAERHLDVERPLFWGLVADRILDYQASNPGLRDRFEAFDLFTPRIERLCLNRQRLVDGGVRRPGGRGRTWRPAGTVVNPLAL